VGTPVELIVRDPTGTVVTGDFTFSASPAEISGSTLTPVSAGTISVSGSESHGCTAGPIDLTVNP
jgi:hypothetical protein